MLQPLTGWLDMHAMAFMASRWSACSSCGGLGGAAAAAKRAPRHQHAKPVSPSARQPVSQSVIWSRGSPGTPAAHR
eukprot:6659650-Pyramimonas_sp.AAC.1